MVVPRESRVEERCESKRPARSQKARSEPVMVVQSGLTQSSKDPVSSWTKTGCGGVPMLTAGGLVGG